jgi:hypothetical protein
VPRTPRLLLAAVAALLAAPLAVPAQASPTGPVTDAAGQALGACDPIDPAHCFLPWPNDFFTAADSSTGTGRRLALNPAVMPRNVAGVPIDPTEFNRNDGFSPGNLVTVRVDGLDTPEAFRASGLVPITDIARYAEKDQPVVVLDAATGERHPVWAELDVNPADPADRTLIVRPAVNFLEGHRYVVGLRNLRRGDGTAIAAGDAFAVFRDRTPSSNAAVEARRPQMESILSTLASAGVARDSLYLAWDFTVASERNLSERMLGIRDAAFAELGDADLADGVVTGSAPRHVITKVTEFAECGDDGCQSGEHPNFLRRVEGQLVVPCFLDQPGCPPGSRFRYLPGSDVPVRVPGSTALAPFICNLPRAALAEPALPSLYGHGLLGSATEVNGGKFGSLGNAHGIALCATDWWGMSSADIPNALSILTELGRMPTLTDRGQQGMLNFLLLGRALVHPQGLSADRAFRVQRDGQDVPLIDTRELVYDGGSQGGIMGGGLTAVAPDFRRAALGVPAMNYSTLLRRSIDFDTYAVVMYTAYPDELERPFLLSLVQLLWDRAESNGYAHHMTADTYPNTPSHEVLMQVAYGDHQVTNWASAVMARTIGARLRAPVLDKGRSNEVEPFWGLKHLRQPTYRGEAVMSLWDVGPLRTVDGRVKGTPPPPAEEVPNTEGVDPHGPDASEGPVGQAQIGAWLNGRGFVDVCGNAPCYLDGWTGPQR